MKLKISHPDCGIFREILTSVLNIATVIAQSGDLPTEHDIKYPQGSGRYWYREDDRYHLAGASNNWWAFVRSESENSIVLEFRFRYDIRTDFCDSLCRLIAVRFSNVVEIV